MPYKSKYLYQLTQQQNFFDEICLDTVLTLLKVNY